METHSQCISLPRTNKKRIVLFPLPFQGHINPMLQLANILHTHDFKITIIHTELNSPNYSNYPHFTFRSIKERVLDIEHELPKNPDIPDHIKYLNRSCKDPFRECLAELCVETDKESSVACVITDAALYFTQAIADDLKLPRMVLRTSSIACVLAYEVLPSYSKKSCFHLTKQDTGYEAPVPEYPLLKFKDIVKITTNLQGYGDYVTTMFKHMKASSGIIWNTLKELEEHDLGTINQHFPVPNFTLGPFHKYFSASSSSLIEQDRTILTWLDTQPPKSTVYVSFGSVACITVSEFQQVAYGLENVGLPFVWVVRPGLVTGSEWIESLPEKYLERVGDRGHIVKWCPQQEVLAHPATGCFWTHNGWNSTLESICEGVPMVSSPCSYDQPINARYVSDVWKIGVLLEDGFIRGEIEMAINKVMMGKEGEEMRERISYLKNKVSISLDEGGSSHRAIKSLVDYILSF